MAPDATAVPEAVGSTDPLKMLELTSRDLAMSAKAMAYDVSEASERKRSVDELARLFFQLARAVDIDLFIEAGANDATSSRRARRLLDPARIVAFEANPFTHRRQSALHDNEGAGVEYLHTALSSEPGEVTFNVLRTDDGSPRADGQSSLLVRTEDLADANVVEVTVAATTLDLFFADHDYRRSAMWVDVEGALRQVFGGGVDTLSRCAVLMVEVEDRDYWSGQWLRPQVVSFLYDRGLVPVARDFQSRYQYNIVFVARDLVDNDRVRWLMTNHQSVAATSGRAPAQPPAAPEPEAEPAAEPVAESAAGPEASATAGDGPTGVRDAVSTQALRLGRSASRRLRGHQGPQR